MRKLRKISRQPDPEGGPAHFYRQRICDKDARKLGDYGQTAPKPGKARRAARRRRRHAQPEPEPTPRPDSRNPYWQAKRAKVLAVGYCLWCGATRQLTVDHIVPRSKGGTNHRRNLQCLCKACNQAKGNLLLSAGPV